MNEFLFATPVEEGRDIEGERMTDSYLEEIYRYLVGVPLFFTV